MMEQKYNIPRRLTTEHIWHLYKRSLEVFGELSVLYGRSDDDSSDELDGSGWCLRPIWTR